MRLAITVCAIIICSGAFILGFASPSHGAATPRHYTVHAGDTLWGIASSRYADSDPRAAVLKIRAANDLHSDTLTVGQTVVLP
jgi:nucleoid-associated protein YgaU